MLLLVYFVNLVWWRAFAPRRHTDVFYLRSFQNDTTSWPIRVAIQDGLGDEVRLSGIRDPKRRISSWSDGLSPWLKAMRHCTPKYMDLEAEDDWRERLWNSLQNGTLAIVDLSKETTFVLEEIKLATQALGPERVVFLGVSPPQNESSIRDIVSKQIGEEMALTVRIFIYPADLPSTQRKLWLRDFKRQIRLVYSEARQLGSIVGRPCPACYRATPDTTKAVPMSRVMIRWMIGLQALVFAFQVLVGLVSQLLTTDRAFQSVILLWGSAPFFCLNLGLFAWNIATYVKDVGIYKRRVKAIVLVVAQVIALGITIMSVWADGVIDERSQLSADELTADNALLRLELTEVRP